MYFSGNLHSLLPKIVYPTEVALTFYDLYLQRIIKTKGLVGSYEEMSVFIEELTEFHKSVLDLKYSLFDQIDEESEKAVESARKVVKICGDSPKVIPEMVTLTEEADKKLIVTIKKGFDSRIARIEQYLRVAKDLKDSFLKK